MYQYDENGYFIAEYTPQNNPVNKNKPLIRSKSTSIKPKFKKGFIPRFKNNKWHLEENLCNKWVYHKETKEESFSQKLGDLEGEYTSISPSNKSDKWDSNLNKWVEGSISKEEKIKNELKWRNRELKDTDKYMLLDYPILEEDKEKIIKYRKRLRDWSISENFPDKKPNKPKILIDKEG